MPRTAIADLLPRKAEDFWSEGSSTLFRYRGAAGRSRVFRLHARTGVSMAQWKMENHIRNNSREFMGSLGSAAGISQRDFSQRHEGHGGETAERLKN
jgi:hypothetical protein